MSSSTMIHGATIPRASTKRIPAETTTIAASHAHTGTARERSRHERCAARRAGTRAASSSAAA